MIPIERTHEYRGRYHVLGGALSPIDGVEPEDLRIAQLYARIAGAETPVREVVLATNPTTTGEATALHIAGGLHERAPEVAVTRLASGLPVGGDLEYADEVTLGPRVRRPARALASAPDGARERGVGAADLAARNPVALRPAVRGAPRRAAGSARAACAQRAYRPSSGAPAAAPSGERAGGAVWARASRVAKRAWPRPVAAPRRRSRSAAASVAESARRRPGICGWKASFALGSSGVAPVSAARLSRLAQPRPPPRRRRRDAGDADHAGGRGRDGDLRRAAAVGRKLAVAPRGHARETVAAARRRRVADRSQRRGHERRVVDRGGRARRAPSRATANTARGVRLGHARRGPRAPGPGAARRGAQAARPRVARRGAGAGDPERSPRGRPSHPRRPQPRAARARLRAGRRGAASWRARQRCGRESSARLISR